MMGVCVCEKVVAATMAADSGTVSELSPMALLKALLDLGHEIGACSKPRACSTQRRNASAMSRRVRVLCLLFEEMIREPRHAMALPPSAVLCLREMHALFQRTKRVVEEWGNRSGLWMVMEAETAAGEFHGVTGDMATALDVLVMPLRLMDVTEEVREQVELLHRQARRARVSVDPADETLRREVLAVIEQFERRVVPEESKLREILRSLGVADSRDCGREIKLMEEELKKQSGSDFLDESAVSMINSLIGLMLYCKCVLFSMSDEPSSEIPAAQPPAAAAAAAEEMIPDDFKCPISLDLMRDPAIVATGQTYDRASITRWIEEGHSTCPKSGQNLLHTNLIPNNALRSLIERWCESHGVPFEKPERTVMVAMATPKAALEATKMTAAFLVAKLESGTPEVKKQVAYELRLLAKCGMDNRACIAEAGAISSLLPLLSSGDSKTQENAVTALLNLSIYEPNKPKIVEAGCLEPIIGVLKEGLSMESRENAAATLFSLSVIDDYKRLIGDHADAIPALVQLLRKGSARGKRDAATALFNLSIYRGNDVKAVAAGAVPLLVALLTDERPSLTDDALAVLAVLASRVEGLLEIQKWSAIPVLVSLLRCASTSRAKENAMAVLVALCRSGGNDVVNQVVAIPSLVPSMYTLLTGGTPRAKRKARSLFKILQRRDSPAAILHSIITSSTTTNTTITTAALR